MCKKRCEWIESRVRGERRDGQRERPLAQSREHTPHFLSFHLQCVKVGVVVGVCGVWCSCLLLWVGRITVCAVYGVRGGMIDHGW